MVRRAEASVHSGAARLDPADGRHARPAAGHRGHDTRPACTSAGLQLHAPMSPCARALRRGVPAGVRGRKRDGTVLAPCPGGRALSAEPIVRAEGVVKYFHQPRRSWRGDPQVVHAVDGVSFDILPGETFGLVGESGCGKTTLGRLMLYLEPLTSGRLEVAGHDLAKLSPRTELDYRQSVQAVFQDPYGSLNPRQTVPDLIGEPISVQEKVGQLGR